MTNELPDVKFENFAAARRCLQIALSSTGAVVKDLSIQDDQNGKAVWLVTLTSSRSFPAPTPDNFVAVRSVLNQHIPHRGVLRQIHRICHMSTALEWAWTVTYGVKKASRIAKAIATLTKVIKEVTPCLKSSPQLQTAIRKRERLNNLEATKSRRRFFYNLRKSSHPTPNERRLSKETSASSSTQMTNRVLRDKNTRNKADAYGNFVKGEVLHHNKTALNTTKTPNVEPNYDRWDINGLIFYMKNITVTDAKALHIISNCDGMKGDYHEYAAAVYHIKNRCPQASREQIPLLYKSILERLNVDASYLGSVTLDNELFGRIRIKNHQYYATAENHTLCIH